MNEQLTKALAGKLLAMADDELILAHRNSEWTGHAPILEEDIAFANIAQDEMGHAMTWYGLHQNLGGEEPDRLVFFRDAGQFRNLPLVELPKGDWAFSMLRQYLFDAYEMVLLTRLLDSQYQPLAEAAAKIRPEEIYHYRHTSSWIRRLGLGTEESNRRTQQALNQIWPYALQIFEPLEDEANLVAAGFTTDQAKLFAPWHEVVGPFLEEVDLTIPAADTRPELNRTRHTEYLPELLQTLQEVARLDPQAEW